MPAGTGPCGSTRTGCPRRRRCSSFEALGYRSPVGRTRTAPCCRSAGRRADLAPRRVHLLVAGRLQLLRRASASATTSTSSRTPATTSTRRAAGTLPRASTPTSATGTPTSTTATGLRRRVPAPVRALLRRPGLLRAHLARPFADHGRPARLRRRAGRRPPHASAEQAGTVFYEWTATRARCRTGPGASRPARPDVNRAGSGRVARLYPTRVLPYGDLAEVLLIASAASPTSEGQQSQVLGDQQWAGSSAACWTPQRRACASATSSTASTSASCGRSTCLLQSSSGDVRPRPERPAGRDLHQRLGRQPDERNRLFRFLRTSELVDNVVMSGDSHGWFAYDLVEDAQARTTSRPPAAGCWARRRRAGALGLRPAPGGRTCSAETAFFARTAARAAPPSTARPSTTRRPPAALPATLGLEAAGHGCQPQPGLLQLEGGVRPRAGAPA
jgi:alkaline phosphatase D